MTYFEAFGPQLFNPDLIDAETREMNRTIEEQMTLAPARWEMTEAYERTLPPEAGSSRPPTRSPAPARSRRPARPGPCRCA